MQLINSAFVDIDDDTEFDQMLDFLMGQKYTNDEIKREFGISSSSSESDNENDQGILDDKGPQPIDSTNDKDSEPAAPHIRINPKTKKVGVPRKLKKVPTADEQKHRKWYAQAERESKQAGEVTLEDLMEALTREQPSLHTTQRRLRSDSEIWRGGWQKAEVSGDEEPHTHDGLILYTVYDTLI
ncbi:hypothetical protein PHMEG_00026966 [Phytophthora megakarya]|uniref:Uncharacterized protein n=1 Tax=Phytophthora megakarya TaxID=4795 RepID=A0A225V939_9STRA|nr:hypothetical protein PHMEG_00026966 [Phytophthora megakarya]